MSRVYNFSAGPAVLPVEVLQEAADEKMCIRDRLKKILSYIDIAKSEGATIACGGERCTEGCLLYTSRCV